MRMFGISSFLGICILASNNVYSQQVLSTTTNIGTEVPNVKFRKILNYNTSKASLSEFKGKIVVLDFWSRGCGSCIASFPKIEAYNSKFKDKLIFIPIIKENINGFNKLKSYSQILRESKLPFVLGDTLLHNIFPHKFVPFYVWVDKDGKLIGTSSTVSEEMIESLLTQGTFVNAAPVKTPTSKVRPKESFDTIKDRLIKRNHQGKTYFSKLTRLSHAESKLRFDNTTSNINYSSDPISGKHMAVEMSLPLLNFLSLAYKTELSNMIFESDSLRKLLPPKGKEKILKWEIENAVLYEITINPDSIEYSINVNDEYLKSDIKEDFGISGEFKEVERECYVFQKDNGDCETKDTAPNEAAAFEITKSGIYIENYAINALLIELSKGLNQSRFQDYPIINETNCKKIKKMYLKIEDFENIENWNKELSKYGFSITLETRKLKTLIIRN